MKQKARQLLLNNPIVEKDDSEVEIVKTKSGRVSRKRKLD